MDIKFYGAAKIVTGSNYLLETDKYKILIDCGMFQGSKEIEEKNFEEFPYDPKEIDILFLTHAHIDHSGRIPKLVKNGFRGRIICTSPTYDLSKIMLKDSAKIQETDVEWENKKRERSGKSMLEPLYNIVDAENSLKYFEPYFYDQKVKINDDIEVRFKDAGHILGSSIIELWIKENDEAIKIVFSGDLGVPNRPIIRNPEYIDGADYLIVESTYGNRLHDSYEDSSKDLIDIINKTALRGGTVIIPSFAVGRTQEIIYMLNNYYEHNKELEEHMRIPIYVDSPMAIEATEAFVKNSSSFNDETKNLILKGDNPFEFSNLRYTKATEESKLLNKYEFPKVIISASGMANAGRVRHHLKHNLWDKRNSLVFVGYQANGTLGRILLDGVKNVKILGEDIKVGAEIYSLEGFSAHADQSMLLDWISKFKTKPKKIFIVHGEEEQANALSKLIERLYKIKTVIPNLGDKFKIEKFKVELKESGEIQTEMFKEDIENQLELTYNQFKALMNRSSEITDDKLIASKYDGIKNQLIDLQHILMDLNITIGK